MTDTNTKARLETIWWAFTLLLAVLILLPIYMKIPEYPFYGYNLLYILVAITATRYLFLLRLTFLARKQVLKIVVIFLVVPLIFLMIEGINLFQTFLDEQGPDVMVNHLNAESRQGIRTYIRSEMLLFGVWAVIAAALLPIRMIISIWKQSNEKN